MKLEIIITMGNKRYRWCEHFTNLRAAFAKAIEDLNVLLGK